MISTIIYFVIATCLVLMAVIPAEALLLKKVVSSAPSNYKQVGEAKSSMGHPIKVFRSLKTGLHFIIAYIDGPVVNGYFTLATEASDDNGLPHTLEHLVFLGSEDYPYKGVLDLLANRCLAKGTNAWTAVDHTAYTVKTGGREGFLNLLPIYLDHLIYPTLTNSGFITEVYHVTGDGEDAGVVYSEMQGRENTGNELTYVSMMRLLYPGKSGYRYETGGIMKNLRLNTTINKIRSYHKEMYRPENLYVIITGPIDADELFSRKDLLDFENKILSKGSRGPFVKPWQKVIPPLTTSITKEVLYPSDSEDIGILRVAWRGPSIIREVEETLAVETLLDYLTESTVSPLPKFFVDIPDPFASEVYGYVVEYSTSAIVLSFSGVPINKLKQIQPHLMQVLQKIQNGSISFNIDQMRDLIRKLILKEESKMETDPHGTVADYIIRHALYGDNDQYLKTIVNRRGTLNGLKKKKESFWTNLLEKYMLNSPTVVIEGVPSILQSKRLQAKVKERVTNRKATAGPEGLQRFKEMVENATKLNEIPPPAEMLQSVPIPSIERIKFHNLSVYSNIEGTENRSILHQNPFIEMKRIPFKIEVDDLDSSFVQLTAKMDTSHLLDENDTDSDKLYIPLLMELLLTSPIRAGSSIVPYEQVVQTLTADTIEADTLNGISFSSTDLFKYGSYSENVAINLKVPLINFEKGTKWIRDILFNVVIDADRVNVTMNKVLNSVSEDTRDGEKMAQLMHDKVVFLKGANVNRGNALVQQKFLKKQLAQFQLTPNVTLNRLMKVYQSITTLDKISLHLAANISKLSSTFNITKALLDIAINKSEHHQKFSLKVVAGSDVRLPYINDGNITGYVAGMGSVESAFFFQVADSIKSYTHKDLPALMVAISYLTQMEGPLWKKIRGQGLAYSYRISVSPREGTLSLKIHRAAQLIRAYDVAKNILQSHINGSEVWDVLLFESGKSALMSTIISREEYINDVVQQSVYSFYRKVSPRYNRELLSLISRTTLEDTKRAAQNYFPPLMDPKQSVIVAVCPTSKAAGVRSGFKKFEHNIELVENLESSIFAGHIIPEAHTRENVDT